MRCFLLASTAWLLPALAMAQSPQVPPIQNASANAAASAPHGSAAATASTIGPQSNAAAAATVSAPAAVGGTATGLPPKLNPLSPSAPLNAKERTSATLAAGWRNHNDRPVRGEDGVLRWPFGASLPSVVCAPLQDCDVALQPGETVNQVHVGDKIRWNVLPAVAGSGAERTTHIVVKPTDAGLVSSMLVYTDRRIYAIKLISTRAQWTPLTGFSYPETAEAAWQAYGATMTAGPGAPTARSGREASASFDAGPVDLDYKLSGSAPWKPIRAYAIAGKTYIQFPDTLRYGTAPALVGLANDGGWFSDPSEQILRYGIKGNQYVVDGVLEHAELVAGVGSSAQTVDIRRTH